MNSNCNQKRSQDLYQKVVMKAWEDESFRQELVSDPIRSIEKLTGEPLNLLEGVTVIVNDQTNPSVIYLNIPAEPEIDDMDLSEEQLEIIAGGGFITTPFLMPETPKDLSKK